MYESEYIQICRELAMMDERIAELPKGRIFPKKHREYVEYYHEWYEKGLGRSKKKRKYVKKSEVEEMKLKIELRKRLQNAKKQKKEQKEYYHRLMVEEGLDPEAIFRKDQERREQLRKNRVIRQERIEADFHHNNIYVTLKGENVRSRVEVIIANLLYMNGILYEYEKRQCIGGEWIKPDFTIYYNGRTIYWEHLGLMEDENYRNDWEFKKRAYTRAGIIEGRNMIITYDFNGISSIEFQYLIDQLILR